MMDKISRYLVAQDCLSDFVGQVASWLNLSLVFILLYEVGSRYFFGAPTIWGHELSTMLFGALSLLAGSYTMRHHGHVRNEVIYGLFSPRLQAFCDMMIYILALIVLIIFLKYSVDFAYDSWKLKEFSNKSVWAPLLYPIKSVIPISIALLILQVIAELVRVTVRFFGVGCECRESAKVR